MKYNKKDNILFWIANNLNVYLLKHILICIKEIEK